MYDSNHIVYINCVKGIVMASEILIARHPQRGVALKRVRKKNAATTDLARRLERTGVSMYALARRSGYSYQHIWNAANGRSAGSPEFWADIEKHLAELEKEQRAKAK